MRIDCSSSLLIGVVASLQIFATKACANDPRGNIFHVPGEYVFRSEKLVSFPKGSTFRLGILLPLFTPAGKNPDEFRRTGWYNQLSVLVEQTGNVASADEYLSKALKPRSYSLDEYKVIRNCKVFTGHLIDPNELIVCEHEARKFVASCQDYRNPVVKRPSCTVIENVDEYHIIYHYSYDYAYLSSEIESQVRTLLKTFSDKD